MSIQSLAIARRRYSARLEYDTSSGTASDIKIPIDDVYFALLNNNVIDIEHFKAEDEKDSFPLVPCRF